MPDRLLGGMSPRLFMRRHWQKRALLVRAALPGFQGVLDRGALFALAARDDVESRLVERTGGRWRVTQGPLSAPRLRRTASSGWTLLVHGVNLHLAAADRLLRRFAFLPQARLDDVMVSYAAPGGGVGPHVDSYDVFLLQGAGRRVWRIARPRRYALEPDAPLELIAGFVPEEEYLLEPGDLLYLPPGWAHDGVALEACFTYSIGFRAPHGAELAAAFLDYLHEHALPRGEYRDPELRPARRPAHIGSDMLAKAAALLARLRWSQRDVERFLGEYLTTPKPQVVFARPRRAPSRAAFATRLARCDALLDPKTQLLYRAARFYLNGEAFAPGPAQRAALAVLADRRRAAGRTLARAGLCDLLFDWYRSGFLHLERAT
ncbi:MAG: cupin domain-containing protein [Betaproteobacteria bacterium]|nr:cupin domain-containing protein [Betaproteobacteria bacterium]